MVLYAQVNHPQATAVSNKGTTDIHNKATVIPRSEHPISRASISPNALKVLYRLKDSGYQAHLVGGGVRDLLLGREPKDFDVATDAHPEDVRRLFRNCRLIGRRFRLAHVVYGREVIEVATFRALHEAALFVTMSTVISRVTPSGAISRSMRCITISQISRLLITRRGCRI